jgi:stearoyl-CoA desaturase (delta-9 desaturase)
MAEAKNAETLARYGHGTPNDWVERNVYSRFTWQGVAIMLGIDLVLFGAAGITVWAVQMVWIPFFAAGVINGLGHFWGYRNYDAPDASRNIAPWGILIGGEELHNNHHTYPTSAKLSSKWYEFDLGWLYIRVLESLGLARVLRIAPVPKVAEPKRSVDLQTLQAAINYRYDLLARYARHLRRTYAEELRRMRLPATERSRFLAVKRWLGNSDVAALPEPQRQTLSEALAQSRALKTLVEMRAELKAIWERSNASREQMLSNLQDWVARAEASGIRALQDLALRIRSYAPVAA